jgi:hypothetical protein
MSQQTETNSTLYYDRTQISFRTGHSGSRQALEFLLRESCFWTASYISNQEKRYMTSCPCCNDARLEAIPIADNEICKYSNHPKRGVMLGASS